VHVLPLPFGLALVVAVSRREPRAEPRAEREPHHRERILADPYGELRRRVA
jgi:hypothetical protein